MTFSNELIQQAKALHTTDDLIALAEKNDIVLTTNEAQTYLEMLHPTSGEVADEELNNVSGGGCKRKPRRITGIYRESCWAWICKDDGAECWTQDERYQIRECKTCGKTSYCCGCKYLVYKEDGDYCTWMC